MQKKANNQINKRTKKIVKKIKNDTKKIKQKSIFANLRNYSAISLIFALMMTIFNHLYMILSLYTVECYGFYMFLFDDIYLNVIFNTIFDIVFFFLMFNIYAYVFLEMLLFPKEKVSRKSKK